jgi:hypothetical protein
MLNVTQSRRDAKKGTSQKSLRLCVSALRQVQPHLSFGVTIQHNNLLFFEKSS